MKQEYQCSTTH